MNHEVKLRCSQKQGSQGRKVLNIDALNCMILTLLFQAVKRAETKLEGMTEAKRCKQEWINIELSFCLLHFPTKMCCIVVTRGKRTFLSSR